jgi:hypothetical protein
VATNSTDGKKANVPKKSMYFSVGLRSTFVLCACASLCSPKSVGLRTVHRSHCTQGTADLCRDGRRKIEVRERERERKNDKACVCSRMRHVRCVGGDTD